MAVFICQGCGIELTSWDGKCPHCGVSETIRLQPSTDRMVDRVVKNKWKIIRKLGQGGMGAVYLAEQVGIGQRVALKFLKSEFSSDTEICRRFLNEAKSYARVAHPNAVTLHDFGQDDEGNLFIAMEYCEGVDLKKVIAEQGRLAVVDAVEVVLQVADVLATAHSRGVIHRDLKPENIMIRRGMRGVHAKVLDFGIARLVDAGTRLTVAGAIAGTPRYMSPEQVEGKEVDLRADIYSLGIVLFETLTGHQPFDGMTIAEILRKQAVEPMPHLTEKVPELDIPELDAVIQKACAKRRDDRWPDLLSFASALSQALPTQAHLALAPLQRSGLTGRVNATPAPEAPSGILVPGTQLNDVEAAGATLVKTTELPPAAKRATGPLQLTVPISATPMPGPTIAGDPSANRTSAALEAQLRPSRAPIALASLAALLLAGFVFYWFGLRTPEPVKTVAVEPDPRPPPPRDPDPRPNLDQAAIRALMIEQNALTSLTQGRNEFATAKLDAAEQYLKAVEPGTPSSPEAQELLAKIKLIRQTLADADKARAAGMCDRAVPLYQQVLKVNPKMADATSGLSSCKAAAIDPTMQ